MDSIILTSIWTPSLPFRGQGLCGWVSLCCQLFGHLSVRVTGAKHRLALLRRNFLWLWLLGSCWSRPSVKSPIKICFFLKNVHVYVCVCFPLQSMSYTDWLNSVVTSDSLGDVILSVLPHICFSIQHVKRALERRFVSFLQFFCFSSFTFLGTFVCCLSKLEGEVITLSP